MVSFPIKQQIFRFEISVDDSIFMKMLNTQKNLMQKFTRLRVINFVMTHDIVKQFPRIGMFHDQVEFSLCFDNLIELDNIRMPYLFKYLNLPRNPVNIRLVLDFVFF
jgi:hypothetical protein